MVAKDLGPIAHCIGATSSTITMKNLPTRVTRSDQTVGNCFQAYSVRRLFKSGGTYCFLPWGGSSQAIQPSNY